MISLNSEILEIKFSGGEISPSKISLTELSANILLFEKLVKPIVETQSPGLELEKSFVGLHELGNRSISLRYIIKQHKTTLIAAFTFLVECISSNKIEQLPLKTVDEIEAISKFNSKYSCEVQFGESVNNEFKTYADFSDEYVTQKISQVRGDTTIYGEIEWIGGVTKPTITLILTNGEKIDVEVKRDDVLNWKPYSNVGIVGEAVWKGKDLKLTKLTAKEIFEFKKLSPNEGFGYLKGLFSKYTLSTDNT